MINEIGYSLRYSQQDFNKNSSSIPQSKLIIFDENLQSNFQKVDQNFLSSKKISDKLYRKELQAIF